MYVSYPAVFYFDKEGRGYNITFPDFTGATMGENEADGMKMASDFLGCKLYDFVVENKEFPKPTNILDVKMEDDGYSDLSKSFVTMVGLDLNQYMKDTETKVVRKNVTIPKYLNEMGKNFNINFSKLLTEALEREFEID